MNFKIESTKFYKTINFIKKVKTDFHYADYLINDEPNLILFPYQLYHKIFFYCMAFTL